MFQNVGCEKDGDFSMNVVFFTHDLDNAGSQKVLVNLANGFVRQGYTVEIVAMLATGLLRSELDRDILVVDLQANALTVVPRLVQYLRHRRPEVMLAFYNAFTLFPLVAQRISGVPVRVIPTVHTMVTNILQESPIPMLRLAYRLTLAVWRRAPIIVAVSETVATDLTKYHIPRDRIRVIYNPVLNREFDQRREELLEDSWIHAVNSNIPIVIGVGRLCHQKNFEALIRSFTIIRKNSKDAKLILVGDGPNRAALEQLVTQLRIQDDVHFAGHVNNPLPFMERAHVLVLSSRYEGLGLVAVEALAVGTPVVGYANLSLKEIAVPSGMMHLVTPGDEAMLACSILETMSLKARKPLMVDLTSQFGEPAVVEQYAALLSTKSGRGSHGTPDTTKAARNILHGAQQTNGS